MFTNHLFEEKKGGGGYLDVLIDTCILSALNSRLLKTLI